MSGHLRARLHLYAHGLRGRQHYQRRSYVCLGVSNWFELCGTRAFGQPQEHRWLLSPLLDTTLGFERWSYTLKAKVIAPNLANNSRPAGADAAFAFAADVPGSQPAPATKRKLPIPRRRVARKLVI